MEERMSISQRRAAGLLCALAVTLLTGVYVGWRVREVGRNGWAGLAYMPAVPKGRESKAVILIQPRSVFMVYPDGPADKAGLRRGDRVMSLDGIPLDRYRDVDALAMRVRGGTIVRFSILRGARALDTNIRFG